MQLREVFARVNLAKLISGLLLITGLLTWATYAAFDGTDNLRVSPLAITHTADSSLPAEVQTQESLTAQYLFDRDTTTEFTPFSSSKINLQLDGAQDIDTLKIYNASAYKLTVRYSSQGSWYSVNEWTDLKLNKLANDWVSLKASTPFVADALELTFVPDVVKGNGPNSINVAAAVKELSFWGAGHRTLVTNASVMDSVFTQDDYEIPAYTKSYNASPEQAVVNLQGATFQLDLPYEPSQIQKVWLSYDAYGLSHWVSAKRKVNGHSAIGGDYRFTDSKWVSLSEPLHPQWLLKGNNSIEFNVPTDVTGSYRVRNLRLMVLLDDGAHFVKSISAQPQTSINAAEFAHDGNTDTGWQPFNTTLAKSEKPSLEMSFDKPVQLDSLRLNLMYRLTGSINIDVLVDNTWVTGSNAISGGNLSSGWNTFAINKTLAAKALRLTFSDNAKSSLEVREIVAVGSGVGSLYHSSINITYPQNGEYFGRTAYIRGYLSNADNGSGEARLFIAGKPVAHDAGAFASLVSKEDLELNTQADDASWQVTVDAVYPDGQQLSTIVELNNYSDSSTTEGELPHITAKATPTEDQLIEYDEASLDVVPGAVDTPVEIKITSLKHDDLPALDPGMTNVTRGPRNGYRFTPHGTKFKKKIKVTIPYDESQIPSGMSVADVKTYYFDEETGHWVALEKVGVEKKNKRIISHTDHFTDMINATITVPDSPQAASFNPTQIKDIKAADPGAGINLIEPPQANNQGSANLSYPIEIPAGRNGMQPQLAIQYNSGGSNGWLGLGWDLSVPSITIDTRWGVPRYSDDFETESYLLNGQQMSPQAHRHEQTIAALPQREEDKSDFKLRVEGSFQKIIRHGDHPEKYWWEVIEKNGTRHFYGAFEDKQDSESVLGGDNGVFKWMLKQTIDTNGNSVIYNYYTDCDSGIGDGGCSGVKGYQLYLSSIEYTHHTSLVNAPYKVEFIRDASRRTDVIIDARGGFKQVTAELLKEIKITFDTESVRRYVLTYGTGSFNKTRLESVAQFGSDGLADKFNTHKFAYYDEVLTDDNNYDVFREANSVVVGDDSVSVSTFIGKSYNQTMLGGSKGTNQGFNGSFGLTGPFVGTILSGNARYSGNSSRSETYTALMDIDGDSRPDKILLKGSTVKYRKNITEPGSSDIVFSEDLYDTTLTKLGETSTSSTTIGFNGYAFGAVKYREQIKTTSTEKSFFSDVNGDGVIDHVNNGLVKFGIPSTDSDGKPVIKFVTDSGDTDNPVDGGEMNTDQLFDELIAEAIEVKKLNPLLDAVRRWVAPYDGFIKVSGNVQLHNYHDDETLEDYQQEDREKYTTDDGVNIAIQLNNLELWRAKLPKNIHTEFAYYDEELEHTSKPDKSLNRLTVKKGDKLYFRVMSYDDGSYDRVNWAPQIDYIDPDTSEPLHHLDVNNRNVYHYSTLTDTIFSGVQTSLPAPYDGKVRFTGILKKGTTSDNLTFKVNVYEYNEDTEKVSTTPKEGDNGSFDLTIPWDDTEEYEITKEFEVNYLDKIEVVFESDSPVDLTALQWLQQPEMFYVEASRKKVDLVTPPRNDEQDETAPEDIELPEDNSDIKDVDVSDFVPVADDLDSDIKDDIKVSETIGNEIRYLIQLPVNFNANIYSGNNLSGSVQSPWKARAEKDGHLLITPWVNVTTKLQICGIDEDDSYLGYWYRLYIERACKNIPETPDGTITFTIKKRGELLYKHSIEVVDQKVDASTIGYNALTVEHVKAKEELFFDFTTSDQLLASRIITSEVHADYGSDVSWNIPFTDGVSARVRTKFGHNSAKDGDVVYGSPAAYIVIRDGDQIIRQRLLNGETDSTRSFDEYFSLNVEADKQLQFDVFSADPQVSLNPKNTNIWTTYSGAQNWVVPKSGKISITPTPTFIDPLKANGTVLFKAYLGNNFVGERYYNVASGQLTPRDESEFRPYPLTVNAIKDKTLRVEFWLHNHNLSTQLVNKGEYVVGYVDDASWTVPDRNDDDIASDRAISVTASPEFDFGADSPDADVNFRVYKSNQLLAEDTFTINNGNLGKTATTLKLTAKEGDALTFVYNVEGESLLKYLVSHPVKVSVDGGSYQNVVSNFNALNIVKPVHKLHILMPRKVQEIKSKPSTIHYPAQDNMFGESYRGWAQASYLADGERAAQKLKESDFIVNTEAAGADTFKSNAYPAIPDFVNKKWGSADGAWEVTASYIKSTRRGLKYIEIPDPDDFKRNEGEERTAGIIRVPRVSYSNGYSDGGGYVLSYTKTRTSSNGRMDIIDLNGDRYPDVVSSGKVQYSLPDGRIGTLGDTSVGNGVSATRSTSSVDESISFGGGTEAPIAPGGQFAKFQTKSSNPQTPSLAGNMGGGDTDTNVDYIDMNGDGLLDRVKQRSQNVVVELNLGYGFADEETWTVNTKVNSEKRIDLTKGSSTNFGLSVGWSSAGRTFSAGVNLSMATNDVARRLMDINGDGLTDVVFVAGTALKVALNNGGGFAKPVVWGQPLKTLEELEELGDYQEEAPPLPSRATLSDGLSTSIGISGNGTTTLTVWCTFVPCIDVVGGAGANYGQTVGQPTISYIDINGDGYIDSLLSANAGNLSVKLAKIGRTNLLKSVERPLGASFNIEYKRVGNTYDLPQSRWVMSKVHVFDGVGSDTPTANSGRDTGSDYRSFKYNYAQGKHDRYEREFLGFASVVQDELNTQGVHAPANVSDGAIFTGSVIDALSSSEIYRRSTQTYLNNTFYTKGLLLESKTEGREINVDGSEGSLVLYRKTQNDYDLKQLANGTELSDLQLLNFPMGRLDPSLTEQQQLWQSYIQNGHAIFPMQVKTEQFFYEGNVNEFKSTFTEHTYDDVGNVIVFHDAGDTLSTNDDVWAQIDYTYNDSSQSACAAAPLYITGKPTRIRVYDNAEASGDWLRKRVADFNNCSDGTGNLSKVRQHLAEGDPAVTTMDNYDGYGNLTQVTGPANDADQSLTMSFAYDTETHTYPVRITNHSFESAIESTAAYDYKFGKPLCTIDVNGNPMAYRYDSFGRTTRITGPSELAEGYSCEQAVGDSTSSTGPFTIKFTYNPYVNLEFNRAISWAKTEHYNRGSTDTIDTYLFTDGIKRVLQTKKTAVVDQGNNTDQGFIVSGRVSFDAFGRSIKQYYPEFETSGESDFNATPNTDVPATIMSYDALDRNLTTTLPDLTQTSIAYDFADLSIGESSSKYFTTSVTDANGKQKVTYRDARELIYAVQEEGATDDSAPIVTTYQYDVLKQITDVFDAANHNTHVEYDELGRRTSINNKDTGLTQYAYDNAGNLIQKITANLAAKTDEEGAETQAAAPIEYIYDYTRLSEIRYPNFPDNNVSYIYGDNSNKGLNQAGRIISVTHQGGTDTREYGKLGEVVKEHKSHPVAAPGGGGGGQVPEYTTEYDFDTFGRLMTLILPDGEVITHGYNAAGNLYSISGNMDGVEYPYLASMSYDKFEQRRSMELGNGIKTRYHYNPAHRRLCKLESGLTLDQSSESAGDCVVLPRVSTSNDEQNTLIGDLGDIPAANAGQFQNLHYAYDNVGNILGQTNAVQTPRRSELGGPVIQTFRYDNLYRLTVGKGKFTQAQGQEHVYQLDMTYNNIHNITQKTQLHELVRNGGKTRTQRATTYDWGYQYEGIQPHAPTNIGNRTFNYDANGNQTGWTHDKNGTKRNITWDDENRIQKIGDPSNTLSFAYDDAGQRVLKRGKLGQTEYVNQFFTVRNQALHSKHIFAGTSRIATKVEPGQPVGRFGESSTTVTDSNVVTTTTSTISTNGRAPEKRSFVERVTQFFTGDNNHPGQGLAHRNERANEVAQNTVKNKHLNGGQLPTGNNKGGNGKNGNNNNNGKGNNGKGNQPGSGSGSNGNSGGGLGNTKLSQSSGGTFLYYYHPDHLGSTGYVTDEDAELYEHIQYFPFGETWVSENSSSTQQIPYRYTSKEMDEETGLYYYGARYYDPRTSVWQSPDPILEQYLPNYEHEEGIQNAGKAGGVFNPSNLGLYTYSYNSPVVYMDPDGNAPKMPWGKGNNGGKGGEIGSPITKWAVKGLEKILPKKTWSKLLGAERKGRNILKRLSPDDVIKSSKRPSRPGSTDSRAVQSLKKKTQGKGKSKYFEGVKTNQQEANKIIKEVMGSKNKSFKEGMNRNGESYVDIYNKGTGQGVRFVDKKFDTFVNMD